MKGNEFERAIKAEALRRGVTIEQMAGLFNTTRGNLYQLFKQEAVSGKYVNLAKELGVRFESINEQLSKPVPLYDVDAAAGSVSIFNDDKTEYIKQYMSIPAFSDCDMFITISGNSMYPKYCSGEIVALKRITDFTVVPFNEAYVVVTKEHRFLKYIRKGKTKDTWLMVSENPDFEPFEVPIKNILHLYIVKGKITKNII